MAIRRTPALVTLITLLFVIASSTWAQDALILDDGNATLSRGSKDTPNVRTVLKSTIGRVGGIAVNSTSGDIFYTTGSNTPSSGAIKRVNSDGSNETNIATNLPFPTGLVLNEATSTLFFIENLTTPQIWSVPADGSASPTMIVTGNASQGPIDLDVDAVAGLIYWTDSRGPSIRRSNLTGGSEEVVVSLVSSTLSGIVLDRNAGRVYWLDGLLGQISYADFTGSLPASGQTLISTTITSGGMAADTSGSPTRLYWTDFSNSTVNNLPIGGTVDTFLSVDAGVAGPVDIGLYSAPTATPTPTITPTATVTATPVSETLAPGTTIDAAPTVAVTGKTVTFVFQNFTNAIRQSAAGHIESATNGALNIRYDVRITAPKKRDNRNLLSKRNELTAKNFKPGNYSVTYRVNAYSKRTKAQIQKAEANGKNGFEAKFKKVFGTNFSPPASFTVQ